MTNKITELVAVIDADDTARVTDMNGWFTVPKNPISKVGVFPYIGKNLPGATDAGRIYQVYRPPSSLSDPACIESFKLLPWIDDHTMLGSEDTGNTPAEKKGVHGVIGENVIFEGDTLYANLKVFSEALADAIDAGKTELSIGYRARYVWTPGVFNGQAYDCVQIDLRGNHIALVDAGRMGPQVSVLDHFHLTIDSKDFEAMTKKELEALAARLRQASAAKGKVTVGKTTDAADPDKKDPADPDKKDPPAAATKDADPAAEPVSSAGDISMTDAIAQLTDLMPLINKLMAAAGCGPDTTPAASDPDTVSTVPAGTEEVTDEEDDKKTAAAMDAAIARNSGRTFKTVVKHIAERDALASQLSTHVGTFDHSEMTVGEVAAYGVEKLGIAAAKGSELAVLNGYLQAPKQGGRAVAGVGMTMDGADKGNAVSRFLSAKK